MSEHTIHVSPRERPRERPVRPPSRGGCCGPAAGCACPACRGLAAFERPRYFSGQLLTEDELRGEQSYVLAKNRLHNRYLHGWGVVCGLELSCDECPGYVTVHPGYALDPCGNDVVVPRTEHFDLAAAIRAERDAARRANCDPYQPKERDCTDVDEHWCITVEYHEEQRRPTTALRQTATKAKACGCNGSSNGHGHPNGNGNGCGCGTKTATPVVTTLGGCEPTRVVEGYVLGVERRDGHVCPSPGDALQATFVGRLVACIKAVLEVGRKRLNETDRTVVLASFAGDQVLAGVSAQGQHDALCRYRAALYELFDDARLGVRCDAACDLDKVVVPPVTQDRESDYTAESAAVRGQLTQILVAHVRDCLCAALLPPCPPDPCDDRVVLGCVRVDGDDVIDVCNLSGRRYAGSFPALAYWTSLGPALAWALCRLCCAGSRRPRRQREQAEAMFMSVDPTGALRQAVVADGFAMPRYYAMQARSLLGKLDPRTLFRGEFVNMTPYLDTSASKTASTLKKKGVTAERVTVESRDAVPARAMATMPFARRGEKVVVYESEGKVVGYARTREAEK